MSVNANLRTRLTQVDASILELKLRLKSLEDNKQSIQDQLDGVVYPILTLPREITSEIFLHCLPPFPDVSDGMKGAPNSAQAPLLLLRVCRTWRDIAVSTPRLWVRLHLDLERLLDVGEPNLEKKIEDWFIRAGACLLFFSVDGHPFDDRHFEVAATRAALVRFAPRLQTVSLGLQPRQLFSLIDIGPFPSLETLTLTVDSDLFSFFGDAQPGSKLLGAAPRLRNLIYRAGAVPSTFLLPYDELSTLTCENLSPDDFFDLLLWAPSLKNFTGSVEDEAVVRHTNIVTHGCLQSLRLSDGCYMYSLPLLRLPALQNIHIDTNIIPDECPDLLSFLGHSSASLRRFSTGVYISSMATEWFSTYMPYLTDIELTLYRGSSRAFLLDFARKLDRAQDKEFLPYLQNLAFRGCILDVDASLLQALASRCTADEGTSILRSFRLWPWESPDELFDESLTTALRALVERGMKISVEEDEL
jgi:hypothetical protein